MNLRLNLRAVWLLIAMTTVGFFSQVTFAQDTDDDLKKEDQVTLARPLVVINMASYEAFINELNYVFDTIERPDIMDTMQGFFENNLRGLKGVTRDQPMGAMLFLRGGFPPAIEPIMYIPVSDVDEAINTVQAGGAIVKETSPGKYKIVSPRRTRHLTVQNGYAFIFLGSDSDQAEEVLDRKFPNPASYTKRMSKQYDFCVSMDLTSVPEGMKVLGMGFLKAQASTELQQRDDEPDGLYQMRRAQGDRTLEGLDLMLKHGERLEIGLDASAEDRKVSLELQIDARADSPLAKSLDDMNSKRSHFARLLQEEAAFSFSTSAKYDEAERDSYMKMLEGLELQLLTEIEERKPEMNPQPVADIMSALRQTAKMQHMDMFVQCYGTPPELKVVGGLRVKGGDSIATSLTSLVSQFKDEPGMEHVELNADTHQNIAFHRIKPPNGEGANVMGADPAVYVGVSSRTIWFSIGGNGAFDQMKTTMDTLMLPPEGPRETKRPPAVRLIFNAKQWLGLAKERELPDDKKEDARAVRRNEFRNKSMNTFVSAFENGDDRLQFDISPTEDGGRFRLELDEGFVRYFAGMVALGVDSGRNRGRERARQRGEDL